MSDMVGEIKFTREYLLEVLGDREFDWTSGEGASKMYIIPREWLGDSEDAYVHTQSLNKFLRRFNLDRHWYYLIIKLRTLEVPKCVCGSNARFSCLHRGFLKSCSTECLGSIKSLNAIEYNSQPHVKLNQSKTRSRLNRLMWDDPESAFNSPEFQIKKGNTFKLKFLDEDWNARRVESIRRTMNTPEYRKFHSGRMKEVLNNPITRKRMSESAIRKFKDPEYKKRFRKSVKRGFLNGRVRKGGKGVKGYYESTKEGRKFYYDSYWELDFMKILDSSDLVLSYDKDNIRIPYKCEKGTIRMYIIDFYLELPNVSVLVEVKAEYLHDHPNTLAKLRYAVDYAYLTGSEYILVGSECRNFEFVNSLLNELNEIKK